MSKIEKLASDTGIDYKAAKEKYGMPFYVLEDRESCIARREFCETFREAKEILYKWIITAYKEKFRHEEGRSIRVW